MPPSTVELVFKRRPRLERVATLRAPRPRVLLPQPFVYPRSPSILRYTNSAQCFAMERELASSSSSSSACFTSPCPACLAHSDSTERGPTSGATAEERAREAARGGAPGAGGRTREPVRESRYGARNGDGLIRGARVRRRKVDR